MILLCIERIVITRKLSKTCFNFSIENKINTKRLFILITDLFHYRVDTYMLHCSIYSNHG